MDIDATAPETADESTTTQIRDTGWLRFLRNPMGITSLVLFLILALTALFSPWLGLRDPIQQFYGDELYGPNAQYWFGTDAFGWDIYARVVRADVGAFSTDPCGTNMEAMYICTFADI